jgi:type I restriction enzyme R subunit
MRQRIVIKLADGKERQFQSMSATSFWSMNGKPMSAAQFLESLYGSLPELFRDEDELRQIWSLPSTRKALLVALEEKGFGPDTLAECQKLIDAENSDLYDVLAYVAFAQQPPHARSSRHDRTAASSSRPNQQAKGLYSLRSSSVREGWRAGTR